jgi:hypothetical protein
METAQNASIWIAKDTSESPMQSETKKQRQTLRTIENLRSSVRFEKIRIRRLVDFWIKAVQKRVLSLRIRMASRIYFQLVISTEWQSMRSEGTLGLSSSENSERVFVSGNVTCRGYTHSSLLLHRFLLRPS